MFVKVTKSWQVWISVQYVRLGLGQIWAWVQTVLAWFIFCLKWCPKLWLSKVFTKTRHSIQRRGLIFPARWLLVCPPYKRQQEWKELLRHILRWPNKEDPTAMTYNTPGPSVKKWHGKTALCTFLTINVPVEEQLTLHPSDLSEVQWEKEIWYWGRQLHSNISIYFSPFDNWPCSAQQGRCSVGTSQHSTEGNTNLNQQRTLGQRFTPTTGVVLHLIIVPPALS